MGNVVTEMRYTLTVRLNKSEHDIVRSRASEAGLPPSTFIRVSALNAIVAPTKSNIPEINREAWGSLARLCANLNQYQAAINARQATGYPPQFLEELRDQVQVLRRDLIGVRDLNARKR